MSRRHHIQMFELAAEAALRGGVPVHGQGRKDENGFFRRAQRIGAAAVRRDGALVTAFNGTPLFVRSPRSHAEVRLTNKLDSGVDVYVVRVMRTGEWACAKPCSTCMQVLASRHVRRVYFTTSNDAYDCEEIAS